MASLLALLSSALWGTADFFGGKLSKKYPAFAVLGAQQFFGFLTGVILVLATGAWHAQALGSGGYLIPGAIAGFTGFGGLICLYAGLSTGRMGVVSPISALAAVIPLGYALVYKGDQLSLIISLGVVLAILGGFLASGPEVSQGVLLWNLSDIYGNWLRVERTHDHDNHENFHLAYRSRDSLQVPGFDSIYSL
jgi:drug/metabolite transporter (DMT)-like permease